MFDFRFYLITDRKACGARSLQSIIGEACDAGVRVVQLREKDLRNAEFNDYVTRLIEITHAHGARLLLNRDTAIEQSQDAFLAASMGTDGFHFPESVPFPHEIRKRFPGLTLGVSTHSRERALAAEIEGADFITFGPVFATPSKEGFGPPQGLDKLAEVTRAVGIPVIAIGGVTPENAVSCIEHGAHGVAVVRAVMEAQDVTQVVGAFEEAIGSL